MEIDRLEAPVSDQVADELIGFWKTVYDTSYDAFRPMLRGAESKQNSDIIYIRREAGRVAGTCHLTVPTAVPTIAGLGEVGTATQFRGRGIGHALCKAARDDFQSAGGDAVFLGTGNPAAAQLYGRLGWRTIPSSHVMVNITDDPPLETFLTSYFRESGATILSEGSPADRVPMIPLIVFPHDCRVLDANTKVYSTRHAVQTSCMGLFPRYDAVAGDGQGAWFAARTAEGKTVGLATARIDDTRRAWIDAFVHDHFLSAWEGLARAAIGWGESEGASACCARVCEEDEEKRSLFADLGFRAAGAGEPFDLDGRPVVAVRMELPLDRAGAVQEAPRA